MTVDIAGTTASDDRVGTMLADRYRLDSVVGRGGMSIVYRAADTFLGRTVAIKVFRPELADADDLRRQRAEIQLLASLNHPTLVTLFDAIADDVGRVSLVLEFIEGRDLREELAYGAMTERMTALIGADIAEALAYIHDRGIVHRDLKPGNLLVPSRTSGELGPQAKLADFGIARLIDSTRLTSTGSVIGTAGYLSPEQALGTDVGAPSDVYSLGLVLLECLTGTRAFEGSGLESAVARLSRDPDIPDDLGVEWGDLLRRMTRRVPAERTSARDACADLRAIAAGIPVGNGGGSIDAGDATMAYSTPDATMRYAPLEPTAVLPARGRDSTAVTRPFTRAGDERAVAHPDGGPLAGSTRPGSGSPEHARPLLRRVVLGVSAALLVIALAAVGFGGLASGGSPPPSPTAVVYPVVPGDLGTHLDQLQKSVTP